MSLAQVKNAQKRRAPRSRCARRGERRGPFDFAQAKPRTQALGLDDPVKLDERCSLEVHSPGLRDL